MIRKVVTLIREDEEWRMVFITFALFLAAPILACIRGGADAFDYFVLGSGAGALATAIIGFFIADGEDSP